jgi:hypothetical protein
MTLQRLKTKSDPVRASGSGLVGKNTLREVKAFTSRAPLVVPLPIGDFFIATALRCEGQASVQLVREFGPGSKAS